MTGGFGRRFRFCVCKLTRTNAPSPYHILPSKSYRTDGFDCLGEVGVFGVRAYRVFGLRLLLGLVGALGGVLPEVGNPLVAFLFLAFRLFVDVLQGGLGILGLGLLGYLDGYSAFHSCASL